jgi:hypothetical protein
MELASHMHSAQRTPASVRGSHVNCSRLLRRHGNFLLGLLPELVRPSLPAIAVAEEFLCPWQGGVANLMGSTVTSHYGDRAGLSRVLWMSLH